MFHGVLHGALQAAFVPQLFSFTYVTEDRAARCPLGSGFVRHHRKRFTRCREVTHRITSQVQSVLLLTVSAYSLRLPKKDWSHHHAKLQCNPS